MSLAALDCVKLSLQIRASNAHVEVFYRRLGYHFEARINMGKILEYRICAGGNRSSHFDCDGTLIDSEPLAHEILVEYLAELGMKMSVRQATKAFKGRRMADCIADSSACATACCRAISTSCSLPRRAAPAADRRIYLLLPVKAAGSPRA